jgi:DNA polymerase-3 subunit epsilon
LHHNIELYKRIYSKNRITSNTNTSTFTAFDVETATHFHDTICQIGIVCVEDGKIIRSIEHLIRPLENRYSPMNMRIHHITPEMTAAMPELNILWNDIYQYFEGKTIVAHNIVFDWALLRKSLAYYGIEPPNPAQKIDTMQLYGKRGLQELCAEMNIELKHHNALSDANAAAQLYLKYIAENSNTSDTKEQRPPRRKTSSQHGLHGEILEHPDLSSINPDSFFYGKNVVFTGIDRKIKELFSNKRLAAI